MLANDLILLMLNQVIARNYLIPNNLAVMANKASLARKASIEKDQVLNLDRHKQLVEQLAKDSLEVFC